MFRSLTGRFIFASVLLLPVLLLTSAYMLDLAFRRSLLSGENERLRAHAYLLLGAAEFSEGMLWMPEEFEEARFNQIDSGLYGLIGDDQGAILWRAPSARLLQVQPPDSTVIPGHTSFSIIPSNQGELFAYSHDVVWETESGERLLRVLVLHHQDMVRAEQAAYRQQLWRWLGLLAVLIVATQLLVLRWGLRPLRSLARDLQLIESGAAAQLHGEYPREIQPVTDNLNQVLNSERNQRERYRHTMQDLAHSLKTPLTVIQGSVRGLAAANDGRETGVISEQLERMRQIIEHQLRRAVINTVVLPGRAQPLEPLVQRLVTSLGKVYLDKQVRVELQLAAGSSFSADERDVMELLGNLIENAFKYCRRRVRIVSEQEAGALSIRIEDDGPGIAAAQRDVILRRGARADTARPGHGIGLAVAVDIVSGYGGSLRVDESSLGGATFVVTLPRRVGADHELRPGP